LGGCGRIVTLADPVEEEVRQYVIGRLCDPRYRRRLARLAQTEQSESVSVADRLTDLEAQREMLLDLYLEKKVTKAAYERRYEAMTDGIQTLHRKAFGRENGNILAELPPTVEELASLWDDKGIGFQRQLIALVIQNIEVTPARKGQHSFDPDRLVWHPK
jgi:hypothetical protein